MIRVTSQWTGATGAPYYTTQHFGGSTQGEAVAAANAVRNFFFQLENILSNQLSVNVQDDVPQIDPATGQILQMFTAPTAAVVFTASDSILPFTSQALIRLRTGVYTAGRELRGHVFVPGATEGRAINGVVDATFVTLLNDTWAFAYGGLPSTNAPQVWSPTHGVNANVSNVSTWDQWAVLRSRRD